MSLKSSCECSKRTLKFIKTPKTTSWLVADNEKVIFDEQICLGPCRNLSVDVVISAEIAGVSGNDVKAYNTYRLYIDDVKVCQSGYETEGSANYAPSLSTASLIWAGHFSCKELITVKVTAQLTEESPSNTLVNSNVNNSLGRFQGSKGAFLKYLLI